MLPPQVFVPGSPIGQFAIGLSVIGGTYAPPFVLDLSYLDGGDVLTPPLFMLDASLIGGEDVLD